MQLDYSSISTSFRKATKEELVLIAKEYGGLEALSYFNNGFDIHKAVLNVLPIVFSTAPMQFCHCCGAYVLNWDKETYLYYKLYTITKVEEKDVLKNTLLNRGILMHINPTKELLEAKSDDKQYIDTFTFDDGEKIVFQFLRVE